MGNILTLKRKKSNTLIDDLTYVYKNGNASNQLDYINDAAGSQNSSSVKEYQNLSTATSDEMAYDNNGNLTRDDDRKITGIRYNLLNLPDTIQFKNGNQIRNSYDAGGQKLRTEYSILETPVVIPVGNIGNPGNPNNSRDIISGTEYDGNIEYSFSNDGGDYQFDLDKIYNDEGYAENPASPKYYYYRKDHLGDNREVWQAGGAGTTVQRTQYYPSGLPWAESLGSSVQKKKYNGKEFVEMHGLDEYDSQARWFYPTGDFTTTMDPLAEKYYSISPYAWCGGNPVKNVDPDGKKIIIIGTKAYRQQVINDLQKLTGQRLILRNGSSGKGIIEHVGHQSGKSGPIGSKLVSDLIKSDKVITIKDVINKSVGNETVYLNDKGAHTNKVGSGSTVYYDPYLKGENIVNADGSTGRSPQIGLAHELGHAKEGVEGKCSTDISDDYSTNIKNFKDGKILIVKDPDNNNERDWMTNSEYNVRTKVDNPIRTEQGEKQRATPEKQ